MKKYSNLYPKIYDFSSLFHAYLNARKGKRYRDEVIGFTDRLEENLIILQNELIWKTYKQSSYREFFVHEPKKRLIMALPFRDRVIQWSIYQTLSPLLERKYIRDSYSCRKGKGTHAALYRLRYWLKKIPGSNSWYYLKLDIHKYFYRVNHDTLLRIYEKHFPDPDLLWLLEQIIRANDGNLGLVDGSTDYDTRAAGVGMAVGNLISQMSANAYLNELDQYTKRILRIKYYIRYMDDIIILHPDKKYLHECRASIEEFLETRLALRTNRKTQIRPIKLGIDWVGYRVWPSHTLLRKSAAKRMKRRLKKLQKDFIDGMIPFEKFNSSFNSYMGILKHCNSRGLREKLCEVLERKNSKYRCKKIRFSAK